MDTKTNYISSLAGAISGTTTFLFNNNLLQSLTIAFLTGFISYLGSKTAKFFLNLKNKKNV